MTVRFGLGTYRCRDIASAAAAALTHGADLIDTAPVYARGHAQTELAPILAAHPNVGVSTKIGFMTRPQADAAHAAGVLTALDAHRRHSISPAYIDHQLQLNRRQLGRDAIDVLFLHNPEHASTDRTLLLRLLTEAFARCEDAVASGAARAYGVATWDGLGEAFTTTELCAAARAAAGGTSTQLAVIQTPISLVRLSHLAQALDGHGPLADATAVGLQVWASAPLNGGDLADLVTPDLAELITPGLTPAQAALAVVASCPGLSRVLVSASTNAHWKEAMAVASVSAATLRKVCDVLRA